MRLSTSALVVLLAGITAMAAGTPPGPRFPAGAVIPRPELRARTASRQARPGDPGVGIFAASQPDWWVAASSLTGTVSRAFGPGLDLQGDPGDGLPGRARAWLGRRPQLLAVPLGELTAGQILPGPSSPGDVRWLRFQQRHDSLRVLGASLSMAVGQGKVVFVASRAVGAVTGPMVPLLTPDDALAAVRLYIGVPDLNLAGVPELALVPRIEDVGVVERLAHDLIWRLEVLADGDSPMDMHHAWVHARDGSMVAFFPDKVSAACTADPRQVVGSVRGGVRPNRADDAEIDMALPGAPVSAGSLLLTADAGGRFAFSGSAASSDLQGTRFKMSCVDCAQQVPLATDDGSGRINFGSGGGSLGAPVTGNGTSTPADRSAFFHLEQGRLLLDKWNVDVLSDLRVSVNVNSVCNAESGAYGLQFFKKGSGCNNTGEIRDVMQHELGHSWDRFDGNGITNGGMSEWKGDMMSLTMGGDACVGESFFINEVSWPSPACSGVRDLDEQRMTLLTRGVRAAECGTGVHCIGSIPGQAIWHLRNNLITGNDYADGAPMPAGNPALSSLQMRWLLERWLLGGGVPMETWDPTAAGVSIYDAIMVADDDDLNLANGTPHAAYINAAFRHHEIEEVPEVPDSANCAAPADPLVSILVEPGEDGQPRVRIDWSGGGQSTVDVLRRRFSGDAFLPVARGLTAGPVLDEAVAAGESWEYLVQTQPTGGCPLVSPGLNVVTVAVDLPALEVRLVNFGESVGDGDLLVEPGETADLDLEIVEVGGLAGATAVNVTLSALDPSVAVNQGGPMAWGDVAAGLTVAGPGAFQLRLADDLLCGSEVVVHLQLEATETCGSSVLRLPLAVVCDSSGAAFVRAVPGSLQVVADTGDQDGLPDNCELTTLSYQVENAGGAASGRITSTVTALDSRSRVMGGGIWHFGGGSPVPGLLPGQSVTAFFTVDLFGWDGPGVAPFAVQIVAAESAGVVTVDLETAVEEDPPVYGTLSFDFESGNQGWTGDGFALSSVRATSGSNSFRGGSANMPWLCQHLLSPVFRLDPAGGASVALQVYADIEPFSGGIWWDRANVHLLEMDTGRHVLLMPQSGLAYTADPAASLTGQLCHVDLEEGWAGNLSPFTSVSFDLSPWSGREIRIEVNYSSDGGDDREGIYVDDVVFTGAATPPQDTQSDLCSFAPEVSPPGSAVPLQVVLGGGNALLTWEDLGPGFAYNVYSGTVGNWFDHGLVPLACAGSGVTCDGVTCSWTSSGLPVGQAYYLVTATRDGRQGPSGFMTSGAPRDPGADSCLP